MTTYDFYPAVLYAIDQIGQGQTMTLACDAANITVSTFRNYVKNDQELQRLLIDAEQAGHDAMADALLQPDNHKLYGQSNPQMAKVMGDNIKWFLSKKDSKRFGEKIEVKHEITMDRAITDAMDAARRRAEGRIVDAEYADVTPTRLIENVVNDVVDAVSEEIVDDVSMEDLLR